MLRECVSLVDRFARLLTFSLYMMMYSIMQRSARHDLDTHCGRVHNPRPTPPPISRYAIKTKIAMQCNQRRTRVLSD